VEWRRASAPSATPQIALITFIVLKLTGVIAWSWWWVLSPIWIGGILLVLADQLGPEGLGDFLAGKADPYTSGGDHKDCGTGGRSA